MYLNTCSARIIGAAIEVHRQLGPGLLESAYQLALEAELRTAGLSFVGQAFLPVTYKGLQLGTGFRIDLIVEDRVIVEIKAIARCLPIHRTQLLTYLRLADKRLGLLLNFHAETMRAGISRVMNGYQRP